MGDALEIGSKGGTYDFKKIDPEQLKEFNKLDTSGGGLLDKSEISAQQLKEWDVTGDGRVELWEFLLQKFGDEYKDLPQSPTAFRDAILMPYVPPTLIQQNNSASDLTSTKNSSDKVDLVGGPALKAVNFSSGNGGSFKPSGNSGTKIDYSGGWHDTGQYNSETIRTVFNPNQSTGNSVVYQNGQGAGISTHQYQGAGTYTTTMHIEKDGQVVVGGPFIFGDAEVDGLEMLDPKNPFMAKVTIHVWKDGHEMVYEKYIDLRDYGYTDPNNINITVSIVIEDGVTKVQYSDVNGNMHTVAEYKDDGKIFDLLNNDKTSLNVNIWGRSEGASGTGKIDFETRYDPSTSS